MKIERDISGKKDIMKMPVLFIVEPSPMAKAGRFPYAHISSLWLSSGRITASIASLIIRRGLTSEPLWL